MVSTYSALEHLTLNSKYPGSNETGWFKNVCVQLETNFWVPVQQWFWYVQCM